jgi:hypothetical protein
LEGLRIYFQSEQTILDTFLDDDEISVKRKVVGYLKDLDKKVEGQHLTFEQILEKLVEKNKRYKSDRILQFIMKTN